MAYERKDEEWFQYYAHLYLKYIDVYKKLEDIYDQMLHPQKKIIIKDMLENSLVRLCEIKQVFFIKRFILLAV